jgi:hypothetical protein
VGVVVQFIEKERRGEKRQGKRKRWPAINTVHQQRESIAFINRGINGKENG